MFSEILVYFFCSVLSILLVFGVTAWVAICFCVEAKHAGTTVMTFAAEDRDAMKTLTVMLRSDRLLNRTNPPIVIDAGMAVEVRRCMEQLAGSGRIVLVPDQPEAVAAAIFKAGLTGREQKNENPIKT